MAMVYKGTISIMYISLPVLLRNLINISMDITKYLLAGGGEFIFPIDI